MSARSGAKISAVISDVDGTLVTDDKSLTTRTEAAVAALRAAGIAFAIVSSRPPRGLRNLVTALGIVTPMVCFNGGVIVEPDLSVLAAHLIAADIARRAVEMLEEQGVDVWAFAGDDWLLRRVGVPYVALERHTVGFEPKLVENFQPFFGSIAKIVGVSTDFGHLARCERKIRATLSNEATVVRSQPYYLDITHPLANKGAALARVAELIDVPLAEIAVVGDGANDVAMFERAALSIAMGNAAPDVRQAANFVTSRNDDDGFASAVDRFILTGARRGVAALTEIANRT